MGTRPKFLTVKILGLVAVACAILPSGRHDQAVAADPDGGELAGVWKRPDGTPKQPLVAFAVGGTGHFTLKWNTHTQIGTLTLTPTSSPKKLALEFREGDHKGATRYGIYKVDTVGNKQRLTLCLAKPNAEAPTEFVRKPGAFELWTLER